MKGLPTNQALALLGCREPVVLAGMGGVSRSELVTAVTAAGGFGFLGMVREPPELIASEVGRLRAASVTRFGVNIIPAATPPDLLARQVEAILALKVPVVGLFWDIDTALVARLREAGIVVAYQVGSAEEAVAAERAGAGLVIAQGREAGGHVCGTAPLRTLLPEIAAAVHVPVLAAGGLATGRDLVAALGFGAHGIVLGTALIAATESFAHDYHKQRLLSAQASDTLLTDRFHINWPAGAMVRVLRNSVTAGRRGEGSGTPVAIGEEAGRPIYLMSTDSPLRVTTGDLEAMALYAGTGVGSVTRIASAAAIIASIVGEAEALLAVEDEAEAANASPACYADEAGGAYMGEVEPDEAEAAVAGVVAELRGYLRRSGPAPVSPDAPPFTADDVARGRWITMLEASLPHPVEPARVGGANGTEADLRMRLGSLLMRLPRGRSKSALARLLSPTGGDGWPGADLVT